MTNYTNKEIRSGLRKKDIPVCRTLIGAKMTCRWLYLKNGNPHWAFYEKYGFVVLNLITARLYNIARKKNNITRMRIRDMDRMCVFRHPRKGWMQEKSKAKAR